MKLEHWALIAGVVVFAVILYANRSCVACGQKYMAMTNAQGAWPGAGPGVATSYPPAS